MDFIEKLKEKQKDQSAKNWFDLGVQTKSQDKKVKYFIKYLLIEPGNAQALRLMADAQQELGLVDAALGSRAKADEIEGLASGFEQDDDVTFETSAFENVNFSSDALNFEEESIPVQQSFSFSNDSPMAGVSADEIIPVDDGMEIIEEPQEELETLNLKSKSNKWAAFEAAKNNELKWDSEAPSEYDAGTRTQDESEMNEYIVIPEENDEGTFVEAAEDKGESTSTKAAVEKPIIIKAEPVVGVKKPVQKVARPAVEKRANVSVTEPPVEKETMVQTTPATVTPTMSQNQVTANVPFTIPMKEIIKFWVVGIVAIVVAGFIMTALVGQ